MKQGETEQYEIEVLLETILKRHGYDFRNYARASLRRRFGICLAKSGLDFFSELIPKVLHEPEFFASLLLDLSVTVTEFFRDPHFYSGFREQVVPVLATYPKLKIWHAGCATGEEAYSMAILLSEEGLLKRTQIYATDFNSKSLKQAKRGVYSLDNMNECRGNYEKAGGKNAFEDYYRSQYGSAKFENFLTRRINFANHNLVKDGVFGDMHVIVCRNVMIYFNRELQNRVLSLFRESLVHRGFLCLGDKETVQFHEAGNSFETVASSERIFRTTSAVSSRVKAKAR